MNSNEETSASLDGERLYRTDNIKHLIVEIKPMIRNLVTLPKEHLQLIRIDDPFFGHTHEFMLPVGTTATWGFMCVYLDIYGTLWTVALGKRYGLLDLNGMAVGYLHFLQHHLELLLAALSDPLK